MARLPDGSNQALVELKAVDAAYPLYGKLESQPDQPLANLLARQGDGFGAVAAPLLLDRLGISVGDDILLGNARIRISGTIAREPDALSDGFGFAPRLMVSADALDASGLVQTGSLVEHGYKVRISDPTQVAAVRSDAEKRFPAAGWSIRTSSNAAPSLTANITRFSQFLTLVGLTALIVGGVGVANAVRAYLDQKRSVIATFKCLGAPASLVAMIYLAQILLIALIGIAIGLVLGALIPFVAAQFLADLLPISTDFRLYPGALGIAALFGVLTALAFAILPLGRARGIPATALFRQQGFDPSGFPAWPYLVGALACLGALAGLAIFTAYDRYISLVFLGAIAFAFIVLRAVSLLISWLARRSPRVSSPALRLAIGNIHRPGALTPSVVLSLGLGLALLVTLALIDGNLRRELTGSMAERAPNFFFVDIQGSEIEGFRTLLEGAMPDGKVIEVPMLRGRIIAFNGEDVNARNVPPSGQWVLRGDRGITYAKNKPENSTLAEGRWWAPDYSGEPLVSFSAEEAGELGLKIGDMVTVNVLGRNITARIANFRNVEWESLSINFVMVFSPNTFAGAPHAWLATVIDPGATPGRSDSAEGGHERLSDDHQRSGEGRSQHCERASRAAGNGDPRRCGRGPGGVRAGAGRRACRWQQSTHPRCRGAKDARRHAHHADTCLQLRIHHSWPCNRGFCAVCRRCFRLVRRQPDHEAAVEFPAGCRRCDCRHRAGDDGRHRARRYLACAGPKGGAGSAGALSGEVNRKSLSCKAINAMAVPNQGAKGLVPKGFRHHIYPQACWSPAAAPGHGMATSRWV